MVLRLIQGMMQSRYCLRCRLVRAMGSYLVSAFDGDMHPVASELCDTCVDECRRGRAVVEACNDAAY
jgi:hypothetical protein